MLCFLLFDVVGLSEKFPYDTIGGFGLGIALGMLICGIYQAGLVYQNKQYQGFCLDTAYFFSHKTQWTYL